MKTNKTREEELAHRMPEDLWLDDSIEPEDLIRLDPCKEVTDLLKLAGFVTLLDEFVAGLPERGWTQRQEELWLKTLKPQNGGRETPEEFMKRIGV
ncbi:MAG: hypothetical protein HUU46_07620 [Candidatus Hydrogenedentes bacterium]|nr:hypothetical protein [Candidatus Hydrogenedentota bacterium]